jgi:hypothetical protein
MRNRVQSTEPRAQPSQNSTPRITSFAGIRRETTRVLTEVRVACLGSEQRAEINSIALIPPYGRNSFGWSD